MLQKPKINSLNKYIFYAYMFNYLKKYTDPREKKNTDTLRLS